MEQIGQVVALKPNQSVEVIIQRMSQCGHNCQECGGACDSGELKINLQDTIGLEVGDRVVLQTIDGKIVKYAYITYGIPLIGLLVGILIGVYGLKSEMIGVLLGIIGLGLSHFVLKKYDSVFKKKNDGIIKIVQKL